LGVGRQAPSERRLKMGRLALAIAVVALAVGFSAVASGGDEQTAEEAKQMPKNPVVFWELASNDMEKSAEFFRKVFDWDVTFNEQIGFYQVPAFEESDGASGGYIFTLKRAKLPFLTVYILVEDIEGMAKKVEDNGGYIVEPPNAITPAYRICLFNEPSGVTFAMIEPTKKAGQ
jgi:predicted enzyme related to lactoylglutathione lyase